MKVSKTLFINTLRCRRFIALHEIYKEREDAVVSVNKDDTLKSLMSYENKQKVAEIVKKMDDLLSDEISLKNDLKLNMMMPYYDKLEILSAGIIKNKFGGNVIYNKDTFKQKYFELKRGDYSFFCFLDGYQEDENTIRIFETKTTTSTKFSSSHFNFKLNNETKPFFIEDEKNVFVPYKDKFEIKGKNNYKTKEKSLFNRSNKLGKYVYDLAYQRYIINKALKTNKKIEYYLVVLNHEYIYDGKKDSNNNPIYSDDLIKFYNLTNILNNDEYNLDDDFDLVTNRINNMDASVYPLSRDCMKTGDECPYLDICHEVLPKENSILTYTFNHAGFVDKKGNKHNTFDLINNEKYLKLTDVPKEYLNRRNNQIQREVVETNKPFYNKEKIRKGIKQLKYPIYHLDFESFNAPLPRYKGETPYMQSVFQYSLHIEKRPNEVSKEKDHYHFLAKDHEDNRLKLLKSLLNNIKDDGGSVLVYSVNFERGRLRDFQKLYPKYYDKLEDIINRLFDLKDLISGNKKLYESLGFDEDIASEYNFYHSKLNGSFSIKKVLPIFSNLSYETMDVKDGQEAMITYNEFPNLSESEFKVKYNNLVEYCKQDTWAMVEILSKLRKI